MKLPDWLEPLECEKEFFGRSKKPAMSDEDIWEFLGNNPFEEWSICEAFDANSQTISHVVNSSMALALQHVAIRSWWDGITICSINDYGSARISWSDLVDDAICYFDPSDEEDKECLIDMAKKFRSFAERIEKKAKGKF